MVAGLIVLLIGVGIAGYLKETKIENGKKPLANVDVDLRFKDNATPKKGEIATLEFVVTPYKNASNATVTFYVPEGIEIVEGSTTWYGKITANETKIFIIKIKPVKEGEFTITASIFNKVSDEQIRYSKTELLGGNSDRIHFYVGGVSPNPKHRETVKTKIQSGKPQANVKVKLRLSNPPKVGDVSDLTFTVFPLENEQNVEVQFIIPNGIKIINGSDRWYGDLKANESYNFSIQIMPLKEGEYTLRGVVSNLKSGGASDRLHFTTSPKVSVSKSQDDMKIDAQTKIIVNYTRVNTKSFNKTMISSDADVIYISGKFETYNGLHKQWEGVWGATVEIWDKDTFGDDKLKTIVIENPDGSFFTSVSNTDGEGGGQEIYLKLIASNNYVSVSPPLNPFDYWAQTDVAPEASNGETLVFNIKSRTDDEKSGAWHVLREIYRGANYKINNEKSVRDYVGKVSVEWPDDSGTYYSNGKIILLKGDRWDDEVILHEYGHFVMDQIYGYIPPTWQNHGFAQHTSQTSAWAEGWANFFQGAVRSNSSYYDGDIDPGAIFNLENTWTPSGEDVEGNIAKSLWDMFDNSKSGDDFNDDFQTSFSKIFNSFKDPETSYTGTGSNKMVDVIREFWENWFQLGYNSLQQMKRIFYYNGIDYGYNSQICVQVSMDKTTYSPSESATLNVMLKDENLNYVEGASVTYLIRNLDEVIIKSGSCFDKGNGKYEAKFNAPETTGSYTVEVTATKSGYADGFASTSFTVINPVEGHNIRLATLELSRNKAEPGDPVQIKCQIDNRGESSIIYIQKTLM